MILTGFLFKTGNLKKNKFKINGTASNYSS